MNIIKRLKFVLFNIPFREDMEGETMYKKIAFFVSENLYYIIDSRGANEFSALQPYDVTTGIFKRTIKVSKAPDNFKV